MYTYLCIHISVYICVCAGEKKHDSAFASFSWIPLQLMMIFHSDGAVFEEVLRGTLEKAH